MPIGVYWITDSDYVKVEWSSEGHEMPAGRIQLWRQDTSSGIWMPVKEVSDSEKQSFEWIDSMVGMGINYKYQLRHYNPLTWDWTILAESDWAVNERPFEAPGGLRIISKTDTTATVIWQPVTGATTYQVQTSTDSGATWQSSTVGGPPVTVPRPSWVKVKAGTHTRSQWSGILRVN